MFTYYTGEKLVCKLHKIRSGRLTLSLEIILFFMLCECVGWEKKRKGTNVVGTRLFYTEFLNTQFYRFILGGKTTNVRHLVFCFVGIIYRERAGFRVGWSKQARGKFRSSTLGRCLTGGVAMVCGKLLTIGSFPESICTWLALMDSVEITPLEEMLRTNKIRN